MMTVERQGTIESGILEDFVIASRAMATGELIQEAEVLCYDAVLTEAGDPVETPSGNHYPFSLHRIQFDEKWGWYGEINCEIIRRSKRHECWNGDHESEVFDSLREVILWVIFELLMIKREG